MDKRIGVSNFVKQRAQESHFNPFDGSWEELLELVQAQWAARYPSPHNPGVRLVPMPPEHLHRFACRIISLQADSALTALYKPRVPGEAPFIQISVLPALGENGAGGKAPAQSVEIILYSHETLAQDDDAPPTREADYYIVSINAYAGTEPEPMHPMTMARNFLNLKGGTRPTTPYTAEAFARAIVFWNQHARLSSDTL
jgi:hypothetical protein